MQFWELEPEWDDNNIEHIARHGVEPEEVEEIVYEDCHPSWIVRVRRRGTRETRWTVFGQTCGGRYFGCCDCPISPQGSLASRNRTKHGAAHSKEIPAVAQKLTVAQRRALEREAAGWDELSDEDFARLFGEGQPVRVRVRRPLPKTLTIALDEQTLNRLKRIARRKQVRARHLVTMWIAERLAQERLPKNNP